MNILVELVHPAHFYYYRDTIANLKRDGHKVIVAIVTKDVLEDVVRQSGVEYVNICPKPHKKYGKIGVAYDMVMRDLRMLWLALRHRVDIITGSTIETAHIGWLLRKPNINIGEDDAAVVMKYIKQIKPFVGVRLTPDCTDNGPIEPKSIHFPGYYKTAYLRPGYFTADAAVPARYGVDVTKPYFLIRFSALNAHHDKGIKGISNEIAERLVKILEPHGTIYITSERPLEPQFEKYRINFGVPKETNECVSNGESGGPEYSLSKRGFDTRTRVMNATDMHHVMAFASLYIGDSQTMAAEAGVLGVPFVRFNDFVGRIGYLNELENDYELGYGIKASAEGSVDALCERVETLVSMPSAERKATFAARRNQMLSDKVDCAKFLTWFIENYPQSADQTRNANEAFWSKFK